MLELEKQYVDQMVAHALEDNPNECCGILAGPQGKGGKALPDDTAAVHVFL